MDMRDDVPLDSSKLSAMQLFAIFLRLGLTSFGGPVAHLGYFREEFVNRRKCLSDDSYADLVALCQFLPGPASSQVGMGIGISQAGIRGALAAWTGFTAPSALALILFAYGVTALQGSTAQIGWLHGLKVVAVAVVAQAIRGMAQSLCPDRLRGSAAILAAALMVLWPSSWGQIAAMLAGGLFGVFFLRAETPPDHASLPIPIGHAVALSCLCLFALLLLGIPILAGLVPNHALALFNSFYRTGSLVFGGGHVVLPLLQAAVVPPGWVSKDLFLAGYGAAQAVPGPLFTVSAYLGAVMRPGPTYWEKLRRIKTVRRALMGVNAAVVGLLLAAFYNPVLTGGILSPKDFILGLVAFGLLTLWNIPPWLVVVVTALGGVAVAAG